MFSCKSLDKQSKIGEWWIDEPSTYLNSEQHINCAKVIKHFVMNSKKTAFVAEQGFIMVKQGLLCTEANLAWKPWRHPQCPCCCVRQQTVTVMAVH